jgi:hypothetical protein
MVRDEQSKIVHNYYELENRYKEIMQENKWIKNEILDLRKNRTHTKAPYENSFNLPLNKSQTTENPHESKSGSTYYTPSRETTEYKFSKRLEDSSFNVLSSQKTLSNNEEKNMR